jgi:sulfur-oxidizing protein SoxY
MATSLQLTRRGAMAAIAATLVARQAFATPESAREWLAGLAPGLKSGTPQEAKISLKAPEIAENGMAVPLTVSVDSEMSEKSYVKALYIAADGNPNPPVAIYEFTPLAGKAEVSLRVKLSQTQNFVAVAEMNDGTLYRASREVKVTIGGCGG